jgi:hypothetical protein
VIAKYPKDKAECKKQMTTFSMGNFTAPGEAGFGLGGFLVAPKNRAEGGACASTLPLPPCFILYL